MGIYEKAILYYGIQHQTVVAIEELAELQKELTKALRGDLNKDHLAEEIADVQIMINQICLMYNIKNTDIFGFQVEKLNRLAERMGK